MTRIGWRGCLAAAAAVALLAGCGGSKSGSGGGGGGLGGGGGGGTTTGSIKVVNSTTYTISQLFVSPVSSGTWGSNQLGSSTIPAGGSFTLTSIPVASYDLKAVASNGTTYWQTAAVSITGGATFTWTLTPPVPTTGSLAVTNHHCNSITQLYVSPSSSGSWGPNQLSGTIAPNGSFTLTGIPTGQYDLKAVAGDGIYWTSFAVSIGSGTTLNWSLSMPSGTGCLKVTNSSSYSVWYFYLPHAPNGCSSGLWGTELLGSSTIPSGTSVTWSNIPAGGYDARAVSQGSAVSWTKCSISIVSGSTYALQLL